METFQYIFVLFNTNRLTLLSNRKAFDTIASGTKLLYDPLKENHEPEPLNADDYPTIKYWYKDQRNEEEERLKK